MLRDLNQIPERLAALIFLLLGFIFGFLLNIYFINNLLVNCIGDFKFWPFIVAGVVSICIGGFQVAVKLHFKRYVFEHFYLILIGLVLICIGGFFLALDEPSKAVYLLCLGHACCYGPALSYINIRTQRSKYRLINIAACHVMYLLGAALSATFIYIEAYNMKQTEYTNGMIFAISPSLFFGFFLLNEVNHYYSTNYNYKRCLDPNLDYENISQQIFAKKVHPMVEDTTSLEPNTGKKPKNEISYTIFAILSKGGSIFYFYFPFVYISLALSNATSATLLVLPSWIGLIGLLLSTIGMLWVDYKMNFLISCFLKVVYLVILTITFSFTLQNTEYKFLMWILSMIFGFGFSHADINILNLSCLKYNEIFMGLGYFIEFGLFGIIQYYTVVKPEAIFNVDEPTPIQFILPHSIGVGCVILLIGLAGIFFIPKQFKDSLLELKNMMAAVPDRVIPTQGGVHPYSNMAANYQTHVHPNYPGLNSGMDFYSYQRPTLNFHDSSVPLEMGYNKPQHSLQTKENEMSTANKVS